MSDPILRSRQRKDASHHYAAVSCQKLLNELECADNDFIRHTIYKCSDRLLQFCGKDNSTNVFASKPCRRRLAMLISFRESFGGILHVLSLLQLLNCKSFKLPWGSLGRYVLMTRQRDVYVLQECL